MRVEMRYDTRCPESTLSVEGDESKKLIISIQPDNAVERMLFEALIDRGVKPELYAQGNSVYPYIEISLKLK